MIAKLRKPISQNRAHAAEEFCRAFRAVATMRVVDATETDWSSVLAYLQRWMRLAGKSRYDAPKPLNRAVVGNRHRREHGAIPD